MFCYMDKFQGRLIAGLIALQGLLLVAGDIGCYLAWHCVKLLSWHGQLGVIVLTLAAMFATVSEIHHRRTE